MRSFKAEAITRLAKKLSRLLEQNAFDEPDGQIEGYFTTEERTIMDCIITICDIPEDSSYSYYADDRPCLIRDDSSTDNSENENA